MKDRLQEDIKEIRDMMDRSTRFISLSGLSGVSTGAVALMGAFMAHHTVFAGHDHLGYDAVALSSMEIRNLLFIAIGTLVVSIGVAVFFTTRTTSRQQLVIWDHKVKRLLISLAIPLVAGGLLCLMLLLKGFVGLLPPLTLIFYGLALVNGSQHTLPEIRGLGLIQILLGLIAMQFIGHGLLFWALGFGVAQLLYGVIIQKRYPL